MGFNVPFGTTEANSLGVMYNVDRTSRQTNSANRPMPSGRAGRVVDSDISHERLGAVSFNALDPLTQAIPECCGPGGGRVY